jgi:hypothetical protein
MRKIYISTDNIAENVKRVIRKKGEDYLPTIIERLEDGSETLHHELELPACRIVSRPEGAQDTGRRVWIEVPE